jgi:hypothetical protein
MGGMTMLALGEAQPQLVLDRVVGAAFVATSPGGIMLANGGRTRDVRPAHARAHRTGLCSAR